MNVASLPLPLVISLLAIQKQKETQRELSRSCSLEKRWNVNAQQYDKTKKALKFHIDGNVLKGFGVSCWVAGGEMILECGTQVHYKDFAGKQRDF